MELRNSRALNITCALLLPFLLETLFLIWTGIPQLPQPPEDVGLATLILTPAIGALFVVRAFPRFGLLIALGYLLVMPFVMFYFGLFIALVVYGDSM
jgi:hypothetical protein